MTLEEVQSRVSKSKKVVLVELSAFVMAIGSMFLNSYLMISYEPDPQIWLIGVGVIAVIVGLISFRARLRQWDEMADDLLSNAWSPEAFKLMRENMLYAPQNARIRILEALFDRFQGPKL